MPENIKVPVEVIEFEFGDELFRSLYGPDKGGVRQLIGFIDVRHISILEELFEREELRKE